MRDKYLKIVILFNMIFLLTGCTVEYKLYVQSDLIYEEFRIYGPETNIDNSNLINAVNKTYGEFYDIEPFYDLFHECESDENCSKGKDPFGFIATKKYNQLSGINNSKIIKEYFGNVTIKTNSDSVTYIFEPDNQLASTLNPTTYNTQFVDEIVVRIYTDYTIVNSNATKVEDDSYVWIYNKDNYKKNIEITFKTDNDNKNISTITVDNTKTEKKNNSRIIYIVISTIVVFAIGLVIFMINKKRKNDRI